MPLFKKKQQEFQISAPSNFQHVKNVDDEEEGEGEDQSPKTKTPKSKTPVYATTSAPQANTNPLAASSPAAPASTAHHCSTLPSSTFPPPSSSSSPGLSTSSSEEKEEKGEGEGEGKEEKSSEKRKKGTITFRRKDKRPKLSETFGSDDLKLDEEDDKKPKAKKEKKSKRMMDRYTSAERDIERDGEKGGEKEEGGEKKAEKEKEPPKEMENKKRSFSMKKSKKKEEDNATFMISSPTHFQTKTAEALAEEAKKEDQWVSGKDIKYDKSTVRGVFPGITCATVTELVSHLLLDSVPSSYRQHFLKSYRTFLSPLQFAHRLKKELEVQQGNSATGAILHLKMSQEGGDSQELKKLEEELEKKKRSKICLVVSEWLVLDPWVLNDQGPEFIEVVEEFVAMAKEKDEDGVVQAFEKAKNVKCDLQETPICEKSLEKEWPDMEDSEIFEIAKQMTLIESSFIEKLTHVDFLNWENFVVVGEQNQTPPNVARIVGFFDTIMNWVTTGVVTSTLLATRVKALTNFIKLAEKLLELFNFSGVAQVLRGLSSPPVEYLKATWKELDKPLLKRYSTLKSVLSTKNNYRNYWEHIKQACAAQKRVIPYLTVHLVQLGELKETLPERTIENEEVQGLVDFKKTSEITGAVSSLLAYTVEKYREKTDQHIEIVPHIRQWLLERSPYSQEESQKWAERIEPPDWEEAVAQMLSTQKLLQVRIDELKKKLKEAESLAEKKKEQEQESQKGSGLLGVKKKRPIPPLLASVSHGLIPTLQNTSVSRFKTKKDFVDYGEDEGEEEKKKEEGNKEGDKEGETELEKREYALTMTKEESDKAGERMKKKKKKKEPKKKKEDEKEEEKEEEEEEKEEEEKEEEKEKEVEKGAEVEKEK